MTENADANFKPRWNLSLLEWKLVSLGLLAIVAFFLLPAIEQARQAAQRSQSKNNLKQIALALVNYHDSFRTLPPGGIFNDQGIPFHSWTTGIDPYTWSSPWYTQVDFEVPWDDPTQIDHFMRRRFIIWENPRVTGFSREDGFPVVHYAANSWLLYRNSSVTLEEIGDTSNTLLAAEARGHYLPLGCPGDWRDMDAGYDNSPDSFGCLGRPDTQVVHADGSVRTIRDDIDPAIWNAMAGRPGLRPAKDRLQGLPWPYVLKREPIWRKRSIGAGFEMTFAKLSLSPAGLLKIQFFDTESKPRRRSLGSQIEELMKFGDIQSVECTGIFDASELDALKMIQNLKTLTLSKATVKGNLQSLRDKLGASVTVN